MFFSKWLLRISSACGVKEVLRLRFLEGSLPINSVRFCMPDLWRASASAIQRSRTGLIFWALLGVMSNFSNLAGYKRPGFSLPVRLLPIVFSWASCGRKKWLLRMVCLGRIEKKESYLSALPEQGISYLLNQNATGTETPQLNSAMLHLEPAPVLRFSFGCCQCLKVQAAQKQLTSSQILHTQRKTHKLRPNIYFIQLGDKIPPQH